MKSTIFLASLLALTIGHHSHASAPAPATEEVAEENARLEHVANAKTLDEFLVWATPAEVFADADITDEEVGAANDLQTVSDGGEYAVEIRIHLNSHSIDVRSPESNFRAGALGGRPGHGTPTGCFHAIGLERMHWSKKYHAPMPNAVFFYPGVAMHTGSLRVPSHGCVHLGSSTSAAVYSIVGAHRGSNRICAAHD